MQEFIQSFWAELVKYIPQIVAALVLGAGAVVRSYLQSRGADQAIKFVVDAPEILTETDGQILSAARRHLKESMSPLIAPLTENGKKSLVKRAAKKVPKKVST